MFLCSKYTSLKKWFADPVFSGHDTTSYIIQENHYYPFGMEFSGTSYMNGQPDNPYMYQGKENHSGQQWLNLHLYDFGARMFDGQTGRWNVPDPVNQTLNSYVGMCNNPIISFDPDGKWAVGGPLPWILYFEACRLACQQQWKEWIDIIGLGSVGQMNTSEPGLNYGLGNGQYIRISSGGSTSWNITNSDYSVEYVFNGGFTYEEMTSSYYIAKCSEEHHEVFRTIPFVNMVYDKSLNAFVYEIGIIGYYEHIDINTSPIWGNSYISSPFGDTNRPLGSSNPHLGTDFAIPNYTPIHSVGFRPGTVVRSDFSTKGYGGIIILNHGKGKKDKDYIYTLYAHLSERYYNSGDVVFSQEIIGLSGGGHLHIEVIAFPYLPGTSQWGNSFYGNIDIRYPLDSLNDLFNNH